MLERISKNQIENLIPIAEGFKVVMPSSTKKMAQNFLSEKSSLFS